MGHEWQATVAGRHERGRGCPFCAHQRVSDETCLANINPELAKEWHPLKNGTLTPRDVFSCSNKKVWWICSSGHDWLDSIAHRSSGRGCSVCRKEKLP
jgi:hypothetical protein